jgi:predicted nucleotidyltransferase
MANQNELTFRLTDTPTAQEHVLLHLLEAAGDECTESQVRDALGLPRSTTHLALVTLVEQGIARKRGVGRTMLYSVDPGDPLVRTLKTARAIRRAQIVLAPVRAEVDLAVLFGSASRGEDRVDSDVDLLIVTERVEAVLEELSSRVWLQPVVMSSAEHMRLIADGGTFAEEVSRGIVLWERR